MAAAFLGDERQLVSQSREAERAETTNLRETPHQHTRRKKRKPENTMYPMQYWRRARKRQNHIPRGGEASPHPQSNHHACARRHDVHIPTNEAQRLSQVVPPKRVLGGP